MEMFLENMIMKNILKNGLDCKARQGQRRKSRPNTSVGGHDKSWFEEKGAPNQP